MSERRPFPAAETTRERLTLLQLLGAWMEAEDWEELEGELGVLNEQSFETTAAFFARLNKLGTTMTVRREELKQRDIESGAIEPGPAPSWWPLRGQA